MSDPTSDGSTPGTAPVIVTKRTLDALGAESAITDAGQARVIEEQLAEISSDPQERVALFAALGAALSELELAAEDADPDVMTTPRDENASVLQSVLAAHATATQKNVVLQPGGLEARFDPSDLAGWVGSFFRILQGKLRGKHPWPGLPPAPTPLPKVARVALLGDWGTNLYGAPHCARHIERDGQFTHLIHLGDVYYSGQSGEIRDRFLTPWPRVRGAVNRACNSNHEMYSGGEAYFTETLEAFEQHTSVFAFRNDEWLLVGLDSGYDDHDLAHDQAEWLEDQIRAAGSAAKVVLFCHHQPISQLDPQGPKITSKLGRILGAGKVFAWYWGHEHRAVLYDPHPLWRFRGRCIGHSGMPAFRDDLSKFKKVDGPGGSTWHELPARQMIPGAVILDGPNPHIRGHEDRYAPNGYATLEFDGPRLFEQVLSADGVPVTKRKQLA